MRHRRGALGGEEAGARVGEGREQARRIQSPLNAVHSKPSQHLSWRFFSLSITILCLPHLGEATAPHRSWRFTSSPRFRQHERVSGMPRGCFRVSTMGQWLRDALCGGPPAARSALVGWNRAFVAQQPPHTIAPSRTVLVLRDQAAVMVSRIEHRIAAITWIWESDLLSNCSFRMAGFVANERGLPGPANTTFLCEGGSSA
jgi:hypothetical protein